MKTFTQFLIESAIEDQLTREFPGVVIHVDDKSKWYTHDNNRKVWYVASIVVPKAQRNSGIGTKVMTRLCQLADQQNATVALTPSADFGGSVSRLKEFYARFGFRKNVGRYSDDSVTGAMIRYPKGLKEAFMRPSSSVKSDPDYYYHATNVENARSIAKTGLKCFKPSYGTDQVCWPDGRNEKRIYMSANAHAVWMFAPEDGQACILRVKRTAAPFRRETGTGDVYSNQPIPAKHLEILKDDGTWIPLNSAF